MHSRFAIIGSIALGCVVNGLFMNGFVNVGGGGGCDGVMKRDRSVKPAVGLPHAHFTQTGIVLQQLVARGHGRELLQKRVDRGAGRRLLLLQH